MELRELHKLYDKHVPQDILKAPGGWPALARCACGKLLITQVLRGKLTDEVPWRPMTHADKRNWSRYAAVRAWLKELSREPR